MGMGEGGVTALEGALGIRPTWFNGGMDTFGPGGSVIAAMMAVATGMARHVLCFRTLWEATYGQLMKEGKVAPPGGARATSWQAAVRRHVGRAHAGAERAAALPPLRHHPRDAGLDRAEPAGQRRAEPDRDLPRPDDDGRLPVGADDHHAVRPLRLRRALRRRDRGDRLGRGRRAGSGQAAGAVRGGRHPDHRTHRLGPDHADPRAAGARPVRPPVDANLVAARRRRRRRALRRVHASTACPGSRRWASAVSARPRTSSTAARTSPATA